MLATGEFDIAGGGEDRMDEDILIMLVECRILMVLLYHIAHILCPKCTLSPCHSLFALFVFVSVFRSTANRVLLCSGLGECRNPSATTKRRNPRSRRSR